MDTPTTPPAPVAEPAEEVKPESKPVAEQPKSVEPVAAEPAVVEPKPVVAEPVAVAEQPKPSAVAEQPKPTAVAEQPKPAVFAEQPKPAVGEEPRRARAEPFILAKPSVAVVVVDTEVARLLQKLVTDDAPVTWSSLPGIVTKAMEIAENVYGLNGVQKRQLVIDALTQLVRTVDKEAGISVADPVFEALLPSLVDHFVAVSKDGLSINLTAPTPASCFAFMCCKK